MGIRAIIKYGVDKVGMSRLRLELLGIKGGVPFHHLDEIKSTVGKLGDSEMARGFLSRYRVIERQIAPVGHPHPYSFVSPEKFQPIKKFLLECTGLALGIEDPH